MLNRKTPRALLAALLVAVGLQFATAGSASAAALTTVGFNISKPHPSDTSVRYSWTFTTATTGTLINVTMSVPAGTTLSGASVSDFYGVGAGTVALAANTVTYTITSPVSVAAGVHVLIAIDGFTNTSTTGSYTSTVTTNAAGPTVVDTAVSGDTVIIDPNTTLVTVAIARSTTLTNSASAINFAMDPAVANDQTAPVTLNIKSNARSGYALNVKATALVTGAPIQTIGLATTGVATGVASASFPVDRWGYTATATGVGTVQGALTTVGNYVGYAAANEVAVQSAAPTNGDVVSLTNRVKIDYAQGAGTYTGTITYTLTESY